MEKSTYENECSKMLDSLATLIKNANQMISVIKSRELKPLNCQYVSSFQLSFRYKVTTKPSVKTILKQQIKFHLAHQNDTEVKKKKRK